MDKLFGFLEFGEASNERFWLDHDRAIMITHQFSVDDSNATRRPQAGNFSGFLRLAERIIVPEPWSYEGTVYQRCHDVWSVGVQLICGEHGKDCMACEVAMEWVNSGTQTWERYPFVTWDGRLFMVGVCDADPCRMLELRLELE